LSLGGETVLSLEPLLSGVVFTRSLDLVSPAGAVEERSLVLPASMVEPPPSIVDRSLLRVEMRS
jgi:hypothetical protein